jgi:hypothetical protein
MPRTLRRLARIAHAGLAPVLLAGLLLGCELGTDASDSDCSVTPSSLDFGTVSIGGSADLTFLIENQGIGRLTGFLSEDSIHYSIVSGGEDLSLASGETKLVRVRFEPSSSGTKLATVDMGSGNCASVTCTGLGGTGPICEVNPDSLDFGDVVVGSHFNRSFSVRNVGDGTLTGAIILNDPHYWVTDGEGSFSLTRDQILLVGVRFEPASPGTKTAVILTGVQCGTIPCEGVAFEAP